MTTPHSDPAREPDRPGEETDTGRGGDRQPGRESTEQPETEGGRMQTRMSLREVVEWMVDPGNAATLEDIEAEARRQLHGEDQEARQQAAIWCPDEAAEARLAGRITAVWARWFATVKAKGKHGQLAVLLPKNGDYPHFKAGLVEGLEEEGKIGRGSQTEGETLVQMGTGRTVEIGTSSSRRQLGWARGYPIDGAFQCGIGTWQRHGDDMGGGAAGAIGSMSHSGKAGRMMWRSGSPPRSWSDGGSTTVAWAVRGHFWSCVKAGRMYTKLWRHGDLQQ